MSRSAEYYRGRAKDCCRRAVIAEDVDRRTHWLEAAARWVSLARQEGFLLPRQTNMLLSLNWQNRGMRCRKISASAKAEPTATSRVNAKTP
jgi:hypothetical protein